MLNSYTKNSYDEGVLDGRTQVMNVIINSYNEQGYISISDGNGSVVNLADTNLVNDAVRNRVVLEIMDFVEKEGSVTLYNEEKELVLVPYVAEE